MDEGFLKRVYKASAVLIVIAGIYALMYLGPLASLHFTVLAIWSTVNIWVLERLLTLWIGGGGRGAFWMLFGLKISVLYVLLVIWLYVVPRQPQAVLAGVSLPYVVIVLKVLGWWMAESSRGARVSRSARTEDSGKSIPKDGPDHDREPSR